MLRLIRQSRPARRTVQCHFQSGLSVRLPNLGVTAHWTVARTDHVSRNIDMLLKWVFEGAEVL